MKAFVINILVWLTLLTLASCTKPSPTPAPVFSAELYYKTQNGADLLNAQTPGYFNKDGIKVFDTQVNGSGVLVNSPSGNLCSGYLCQPDNTGFYSIQFVVRPTNELRGAVVQLSSSVMDTLTYQIISATPQSGYAVNKVSYKGQVIWSRGMPTPVSITIVK